MDLEKLESYLRVNLLDPGRSPYEKIIYRAAVSQRLRNTALHVSDIKRPSSGGTTLAVFFVRVVCTISCCLVASCGLTGLLGFEGMFKGPLAL
jgi:hypothetical protein